MNGDKFLDPADGFRREETGILVFLPASDIRRRDAYAHGIFAIDLDEGTSFHRMRLDATLRLLSHGMKEAPRLGGLGDARPRRLLDIGCGLGHTLEAVARTFPDVELTGLDLSLTALERAVRRVPQAEFVLCDCGVLPFSKEYFDVVILGNVIEHVPDPVPLLCRTARVMAPDGVIVLSTPSRYRFDNLFRAVLGKPMGRMSTDHIVEYTVGQVSEMLTHAGFELRMVEGPRRTPARRTLRSTLPTAVVAPLLRAWVASVHSRHVLETTAFFLARLRS